MKNSQKLLIVLLTISNLNIFSQVKTSSSNNDRVKLEASSLPKELKEIISNIKIKNKSKSIDSYTLLKEYLNTPSENFSSIENYCFAANYAIEELNQKLESTNLVALKSTFTEGYHKLCFSIIHSKNTSLNELSEVWNSIQLTRKNSWIDQGAYFFEYQDSLFKPIFKIYFEQLTKSKNEIEQNTILNKCLSLFPGIDVTYGQKDQLLGKILMNSEGSGTITIFKQSYLSYFLN